jgi:ATP-dependent exoDNAse (exonuclease V) beta subunit
MVAALEAQQIPADTLAQRGIGDAAVHLMTAHRSKGLEWPLVVVAGVQDGEWPDTRMRSSLLQVERLETDRVAEPVTARKLVAEERRLFYVACSRAKRHLVVTAVHAATEEGDQPSRFVAEMHGHVTGSPQRSLPETRLERPKRGMSLRAAIAELRRIGESTDDPTVRDRSAAALARLAAHPAGRTADPERWWGLRELSQSGQPLRDPEQPLKISGSQVSQVVSCPLHWFFDHEARGGQGSTSAQGFGKIVHALAAEVVNSSLDPDPSALAAHLDEVWDQLPYEAAWIGRRERTAATEAILRFCEWHASSGRTAVEAERDFTVEHEVDGHPVVLNGKIDRVELGDDGVHVVDLKTSKTRPRGADVAEHPQLGFYQVAIDLGATAEVTGDAPSAGAELVMLRSPASRALPDQPYVLAQDAPVPGEVFFGVEHLRRTVHVMADEALVATESKDACQYCTFQAVCPAKDEGRTILGDGA